MSVLITYLLKLSISLAVVWLFYQFVLRRLTFYNSNRWYLLGYTALCFFLPFINVGTVVNKGQLDNSSIIQLIPTMEIYTNRIEGATECPVPLWSTTLDKWDWILLLIGIGAALLLLRFLVRCFSFWRLRSKATLLSEQGMKLYHVNSSIIPFSFGNSIFINRDQHSEEELREIIHHEFIHVKQRHTVDIIWAEIFCMLNWYNPFAWLLKADIRQNLEFIADNKVLENGINKKQYQYLLLKVIGNKNFSIAQQFNFSSLKKRIAMMNKNKSARVHLLRFLFMLPLLAVILVSFRKQIGDTLRGPDVIDKIAPQAYAIDTVPSQKVPNKKGYYIDIIGVGGDCTVVVKDKNKKEVTRLLLTDWDKKEDYYEGLYGKIPPPPPPPPPDAPTAPAPPTPPSVVTIAAPPAPPIPPTPPAEEDVSGLSDFLKRNPEVKSVGYVFNRDNTVAIYHLIKKDGSSEEIDMRKETERKRGLDKYGEFPVPSTTPPPPPVAPVKSITTTIAPVAIGSNDGINLAGVSSEYEITDKKAMIKLKNGKVENYDLTNKQQRAAFEKKYGKIINVNTNVNANVRTTVNAKVASSINANVHAVTNTNINSDLNTVISLAPITSISSGSNLTAVVAPAALRSTVTPTKAIATSPSKLNGVVAVIDDRSYVITGNEDIVVTITNKTTRQELDKFIVQMKEKNIDLSFDEINHDESGVLVKISGKMKSKDGSQSNFVVSDFKKLVLAMIMKDGKTYFKVNTGQKKEVI